MIVSYLQIQCQKTLCPQYGECCFLPTEYHNESGEKQVDLFIVGQGAGKDEEKDKRPWVGKAGRLLRSILRDLVKEHGKIGIALGNTVRCRPSVIIDDNPENPIIKDREPNNLEISNCIEYLHKDIEELSPKVVLLCGRHTSSQFGYNGPVSTFRGVPSLIQGKIYLPTYHPAGALRNPNYIKDMKNDISRCFQLCTDTTEFDKLVSEYS